MFTANVLLCNYPITNTFYLLNPQAILVGKIKINITFNIIPYYRKKDNNLFGVVLSLKQTKPFKFGIYIIPHNNKLIKTIDAD